MSADNSFDFDDSDKSDEEKQLGLSQSIKPGLHASARPDLGKNLWELPGVAKEIVDIIPKARPTTGGGKTINLGKSDSSKALPREIQTAKPNTDSKPPIKLGVNPPPTTFVPPEKKPIGLLLKKKASVGKLKFNPNPEKSDSDDNKEGWDPTAPKKSTTGGGKLGKITLKKADAVVKKKESSSESASDEDEEDTGIIVKSEVQNLDSKGNVTEKPKAVKKNAKPVESESEDDSSFEEAKPAPKTKPAPAKLPEKNPGVKTKKEKTPEPSESESGSESEEAPPVKKAPAKPAPKKKKQKTPEPSKSESGSEDSEETEHEKQAALIKKLQAELDEKKELERQAKAKAEEEQSEEEEQQSASESEEEEEEEQDVQAGHHPQQRNENLIAENDTENIPNDPNANYDPRDDPEDQDLDNEDIDPNGVEYAVVNVARLEDLDMTDPVRFATSMPPPGKMIQCTITRDKSSIGKKFLPVYHITLSKEGTYIMSAKKRGFNKTSNYTLSAKPDELSKKSPFCIGKVRSNFLGTEFNAYSEGKNPSKSKKVDLWRHHYATVKYEQNIFGMKGPRKMTVYVPGVNDNGELVKVKPKGKKDCIYPRWKKGDRNGIMRLINKPPKWSEEYQAFVLNFYGRVRAASVKNFQIIDESRPDFIFLQFGKVNEHSFTMDFQWPVTPVQAMMICLTSFDFKWFCE